MTENTMIRSHTRDKTQRIQGRIYLEFKGRKFRLGP
jgi:hypothetical protein